MANILFITHPDVVIDSEIAVPNWPLSRRGRHRMAEFALGAVAGQVQWIVRSEERKAAHHLAIVRVSAKLPEHSMPRIFHSPLPILP